MNKRRTLVLLCVAACVAVGGYCWYQGGQRQYTITTPVEFPVIPEGEHPKYRETEAAAKFYWIDQEVIDQMTTEALLETYLACPDTIQLFLANSRISGFRKIVNEYHYGVAELLVREDLPQVLLSRYLQTEVFKYDPEEDEHAFFKKESHIVWELRYMEIMAACLNLDIHDKTEGRLFRAIERNDLLYGRGHKGFYQGASAYFFTRQQAEHVGEFKGETYKTSK